MKLNNIVFETFPFLHILFITLILSYKYKYCRKYLKLKMMTRFIKINISK